MNASNEIESPQENDTGNENGAGPAPSFDDWARFVAKQSDWVVCAQNLQRNIGLDAAKLLKRAGELSKGPAQ